MEHVFGLTPPFADWVKEEEVEPEMFVERLQALTDKQIEDKIAEVQPDDWIYFEKQILLQSLDHHWKDHLSMLDALRQVVHLRADAQKKPIDEYKHEAFSMFERMLAVIREDVTGVLARAQIAPQDQQQLSDLPVLPPFLAHIDPYTLDEEGAQVDAGTGAILSRLPPLSVGGQPGASAPGGDVAAPASRNAPCPCGSGRKYKHCHGAAA